MPWVFNPFTGKLDQTGAGAAQVNSDWNSTSGVSQILNKPTIQTFDQSLNKANDVRFSSVTLGELDEIRSYVNSLNVGGINPDTGGEWFFNANGYGLVTNGFICGSLNSSGNVTCVRQIITAAANTSALTASYSVTGANTTPLLDLSGTWNTTGAAQGILLNVTRTAATDASTLLALRVGGANRFSIIDTVAASPTISVGGSGTNWNIRTRVSSGVGCNFDGVVGLGGTLQFLSSAGSIGGGDTILARDAANTLALRNGTNAQAFRLYNTFTDASNFERGFMRWNSNLLEIGTEAGGTGTAGRSVRLMIGTQSSGVVFSAAGSGVDINARSFTTGANMTLVGSNISGLATCNYTSASTDPTTTTITNGNWQVHRNTTSGTIRLWANNAGTLVSVALA
jgi:hypothetical protein